MDLQTLSAMLNKPRPHYSPGPLQVAKMINDIITPRTLISTLAIIQQCSASYNHFIACLSPKPL